MELPDYPRAQFLAAQDELDKSKLEWFCLDCGRPRRKNWCPYNSAKPNDPFPHTVVERKAILPDTQIRLFLSNQKGESTRHVFKR